MALLTIPYDRSGLELALDDRRLAAVLAPKGLNAGAFGDDPIGHALANPHDSLPLAELARGKQRIAVITSDHTRPLPSAETLPRLLREIRAGNPGAEVTILIGTGTHRPMTREEMYARFGEGIMERECLVCHRGDEPEALALIGRLPSGAPLEINRLAVEADLLVAEGFIEPHFFAGFSGGPKSVLPGIAGRRAILANHSGPNIGHPSARAGILDGNPVHEEMRAAARLARLAFILNVVLDERGRVAAAFAGGWHASHTAGAAFVLEHARVGVAPAPIAVTSNGGYPLDQNLYQAVKGMTAAEAAVQPGGRIIIAAGCADGMGGEGFAGLLAGMGEPAAFYARACATPADETVQDLWQAQILARILSKCRVTVVTGHLAPDTALPRGLTIKRTLGEAVAEALAEAGPEAKVTVIPDGVGVIPEYR